MVGQLELELTGEVLDRRDVAQHLGDTIFDEPIERVGLDFDEIRRSLTSRNFENEKRSRNVTRANVTPIRGGSRCRAPAAGDCATAGGISRNTAGGISETPRRAPCSGRGSVRGRETRKARAGRHGPAQHSPRPCWLPTPWRWPGDRSSRPLHEYGRGGYDGTRRLTTTRNRKIRSRVGASPVLT